MKERIRTFLEEEILDGGGAGLGDEDDLLLGGLVDSIGLMRLIAFLEESCRITVPPEDVTIERFRSISSIAAYLSERGARDE